MFCRKCGAQLHENAVFCTQCGARLVTPEGSSPGPSTHENTLISGVGETTPPAPSTVKAAAAHRKFPVKWVIIAAVVVIAVVVLAFLLTRPKTIDLSKYLSIETEGYDGYGRATAVFDYETFFEDCGDKLKATKEYSGFQSERLKSLLGGKIENSLVMNLDQETNIANGDTLTMTCALSEDIADYIQNKIEYPETLTYTIDNLMAVKTVDVFPSVVVRFSGASPLGCAELEFGDTIGEIFQSIRYTLDPSTNLSNGDSVTVSIQNPYDTETEFIEYCLNEYGEAPEAMEKVFTVEGLGSYISSIDEITDEVIESATEAERRRLNDVVNSDWVNPDSLIDEQLLGIYFLTPTSQVADFQNKMYLVFRITVEDSEGVFSYYSYSMVSDMVKETDGSITVDYNNFITPQGGVSWFSVYGDAFKRNGLVYVGFENFEDLYRRCVTVNENYYTVESTVSLD